MKTPSESSMSTIRVTLKMDSGRCGVPLLFVCAFLTLGGAIPDGGRGLTPVHSPGHPPEQHEGSHPYMNPSSPTYPQNCCEFIRVVLSAGVRPFSVFSSRSV